MVLIFLASVGIGYFYLNTRTDQKKESKADDNIIWKNNIENEIAETEAEVVEKISPNCKIIERTFYKKCGHEIEENWIVNKSWVNFSKEELEDILDDEDIEEFSTNEIILYKKEDKMCPEHYIIGEANGLINIYKLNQNGEAELYEVTNIYLEYLPEEEKEKLKETVEVMGREELNSVLENLAS